MSKQESQEQNTSLVPNDNLPEVRRIWHNNEWFYAVVDFIKIWTESEDSFGYWRQMKRRADLELQHVIDTQLVSFPMKAADGRRRQTETANRETLLRLVQSVPSKNAEKVRLWLAEVGNRRLEEIEQEPIALEQLRNEYRRKGYDDTWIEARIVDLLARNEITVTWKERGAEEIHYPVLTNILVERTFGLTIKSYKVYKSISPNTNLPDNMTVQELAVNALSKATAITFHEARDSQGIGELRRDAIDAGDTTRAARELIEQRTGVPIVSRKNAKDLRQIAPKKKKEILPPRNTLFD